MQCVFLLTHRRIVEHSKTEGDIYNTKVLGIYKTKRHATETVTFFMDKPGFCDYPNDFYIQKKKIKGSCKEHQSAVYLVEYERMLDKNLYIYKLLCICADMPEAETAIAEYKQKSGFDSKTEEYDIIEYQLDKHSEYWKEGFDTGRP